MVILNFDRGTVVGLWFRRMAADVDAPKTLARDGVREAAATHRGRMERRQQARDAATGAGNRQETGRQTPARRGRRGRQQDQQQRQKQEQVPLWVQEQRKEQQQQQRPSPAWEQYYVDRDLGLGYAVGTKSSLQHLQIADSSTASAREAVNGHQKLRQQMLSPQQQQQQQQQEEEEQQRKQMGVRQDIENWLSEQQHQQQQSSSQAFPSNNVEADAATAMGVLHRHVQEQKEQQQQQNYVADAGAATDQSPGVDIAGQQQSVQVGEADIAVQPLLQPIATMGGEVKPPQQEVEQQQQQEARAESVSASVDRQQPQVAQDEAPIPRPQEDGPALEAEPTPQPEDSLLELSNFQDTWSPLSPTDIPIFWNVQESGGATVRAAMGGCHRLVQATGWGAKNDETDGSRVGIVYPEEGVPFVNVDTTTVDGIGRAREMGFADAQVADVAVSPLVYEANGLFTPASRGRLFAVFRHPIERAARYFGHLQKAEPWMKYWTLERYAKSDYVEDNRLTRLLSNRLDGCGECELTEEHYRRAVEIVSRKFLVGLATQLEPSMDRFEKFFRWKYRIHPLTQEECRSKVMAEAVDADANAERKIPKEGDAAWAWLAHRNQYDLRLYAYIERLFEEQAVFVKGQQDNYRNAESTCCKCDPPSFPPGTGEFDAEDEEGAGLLFQTLGGQRIFRKLPSSLVSALFVPCNPDPDET